MLDDHALFYMYDHLGISLREVSECIRANPLDWSQYSRHYYVAKVYRKVHMKVIELQS